MKLLRKFLSAGACLALSVASLAAQRAPLMASATVDRTAAHIDLTVTGAPNSTMVLMFSTQQPLLHPIQTPWGQLCLDPGSIIASVPVQLDGFGRANLRGHFTRPYSPFVLSVQGVTFVGTNAQLVNVAVFAGGEALNAANTITYSAGTFTAAATGNRGDQIEVKTNDGTLIGAGAVQADGSTVNLSGGVPAGATSIGLYRNGVLISWVRC